MIKCVAKTILPTALLTQRLPKPRNGRVLLTFDDGPHSEVTPKVLDLLDKYEAKAIFFVPGRRVSRAPRLLPIIIERGHEIGNHSYSHVNGKQPSFFNYLQDIKKCQQILEEHYGISPRFFRPPHGIVSPATLLSAKIAGLRMMTWSCECRDWQINSRIASQQAAQDVLREVRDGDIILLHDDNRYSVDILNIILPGLSARGIDMVKGLDLL